MNNYKLRFVPLGGMTNVTKNMYLYELYNNDQLQDILIVDCGIGFPRSRELGVDFVIPDISYLTDKVSKIRAVILSHGHEDHISALPYHYGALGKPPIYASKLTKVLLENKFKEFSFRPKINEIDFKKELVINLFCLTFIKMTHSIPDTVHILIKTPIGNFYHGTDYKLDLTPPFGSCPDFYQITKAGHEGILCLMSDCLGSEREGLTLSEKIVGSTFEDEMRKTKGKFVMTTFSSNISRIRQCVDAAIKFNRKICFLGRSMKENSKLSSRIGYLPIPHSLLIDEKDCLKTPSNRLCLIVAGSQGQYNSALSKLGRDQNPSVKISAGDKIVFSSDPIPGNEEEVYGLVEEIITKGADVIYPAITDQLHASGHANQEDMKFLIRFTNPQYFLPIGGTIRHQRQYQCLADELGYPKGNVFMLSEGETVWFEKHKANLGKSIETQSVYVDAYGVGDVGNIVLRDRQTLAQEGMVVAFINLNNRGLLVSEPKLISRGFVFEKEEKDLYYRAVSEIKRVTKPRGKNILNLNNTKKEIIDVLENLFFKERGRKPLIVVEIVSL